MLENVMKALLCHLVASSNISFFRNKEPTAEKEAKDPEIAKLE
jgi:hypothetical protein